MRFHLRTFGCKTNQYESQGIREAFLRADLEETDAAAAADIVVVNTCSVTRRADASCRGALRQIRRANPDARLIVTGCAVDLKRDWLREIDALLVGNDDKHTLVTRALERTVTAAPARFGFRLDGFQGHTRAFVKIQDGCANRCAYCTIPDARGAPVSRPLDEIISETVNLVAHGVPELVLTGINIGAYRGIRGETLAAVIRALACVSGLQRLRLGSVEPDAVTDDLLEAMATSPTVAPHLHIPLQAGDDTVLAEMNRRYTADEYLACIDRARAALDDPGITTDVIVGFPTEDETGFANTMRTCARARFSRMHIFLFSSRPDTPAAELPQAVRDKMVHARKKRLSALADEMAAAFAADGIGKTEWLLPETCDNDLLEGYTGRYLRAEAPGAPAHLGRLVPIAVTGSDGALQRGTLR